MAYAYVRDLGLKEKEVFINEKSENLSEEYKFKVDLEVQELLKVRITPINCANFLGISWKNKTKT